MRLCRKRLAEDWQAKMNKKGQMPKVKLTLTIVAIGVVILIAAYFIGGFKIVGELQEQGKVIAEKTEKVNTAVERLNTNLGAIEQIPSQVETIQNDIAALNQKVSTLNSDMSTFQSTGEGFSKSLDSFNQQLIALNGQIEEMNKNIEELKELQTIYPPVQTQQLIFENVSNQEVNQAIQNAINLRSRSFGIYFGFGSLFGSIFSVSLYFIWQFYKKRRESQ